MATMVLSSIVDVNFHRNPTHKGILQGRKSPESCGRRNSSSVIKPSFVNHGSGQQTNSAPSSARLQGNGCSTGEPRRLDRALSEPADRKIAQSNSSRYKTELCRPFEENGTCKYGDKCQFAHGVKELRTLARHPKYKTELCRTFHSLGLCPYGPRCHFIHNSEQTKQSLMTNLAVNPNSNAGRPKALSSSSLGSTGEISPPSSHGGSPTLMKSFDDLFHGQTPMSPNLNGNTAFSFSQDFAAIVNPAKNVPSLSFGGMSHAARALFELPVSSPEIYSLALYQDTLASASSVFGCSPTSPVDTTSDLDCLNLGGSVAVPVPFSQSSATSPPALNSPLDINNPFGRLAFFSNLGSQE